jgi:hypothetical protein
MPFNAGIFICKATRDTAARERKKIDDFPGYNIRTKLTGESGGVP